ncbi:MAG: flagellar biosynthesis protein FlhB [Anaerolineae bacterium]|nr:flagellar biosynthesis protein FlhB [Anaerolineae bacterium]
MEEAREEGQVAQSRELNSAAIILASALLLRGPGAQLGQNMMNGIAEAVESLPTANLSTNYLQTTLFGIITDILAPLGIIVVSLLAIGAVVTLGQTQFLWSSKRVGFDFKRIDPISGFKRIFSSHGLIELARALLKILLVGWVTYSYLKDHYTELLTLSQLDLTSAALQAFNLMISLIIQVGGTYLALAVADYAYQRWDLMRNLKMTKEEIKEEVKRSEGDPALKGRIRAQMRRMARGRMMAAVPKATVIVTNPTHLAIAIQYSEGMNAPKILAKGANFTAKRIIEIARENNIPVIQNIPLARAIFKTIEVDQEISPDLYLAMAEVLATVYRLRGQVPAPAAS